MNNNKNTFWGGILVLLGSLFLVRELLPDMDIERFIWPTLLIGGGLLLIFRDKWRTS